MSTGRVSLAILIGGRGRRLGGVDKASISLGDTTTGQALLDTFAPRVDACFAVGREDQRSHPLLRSLPLVVDSAPDEGPLRGIATALAHARCGWVFVVACDLTGLRRSDLGRLVGAGNRGHLAIAWRSPSGVEPLCALYHCALASTAARLLAAGERRASALLAGARLSDRASPITNINTPDDLAVSARGFAGRDGVI